MKANNAVCLDPHLIAGKQKILIDFKGVNEGLLNAWVVRRKSWVKIVVYVKQY